MDKKYQIDTFFRFFRVSRETIESLNQYEKMLVKANKNLNLVGKSTLKDIWFRHFLDSFQVIDFIDKNDNNIIDMGSGAGFPGLVLAIGAKERNLNINIKLIEKSRKKIDFLKSVIKDLDLKAETINQNIFDENIKLEANVFVARAFKPLKIMLGLIHSKCTNWKKILLFQGKQGGQELLEASKNWNIEYKQRVSCTSNDSKILKIINLKKK
jgi:16S rRNA (guanine527-N7)-methyltransferase